MINKKEYNNQCGLERQMMFPKGLSDRESEIFDITGKLH